MRSFIFISLFLLCAFRLFSQASGNINYQNQFQYVDQTMNLSVHPNSHLEISAKGMMNVEADSFVAIFSVSQTAKTAQEVNQLMDGRINAALNDLAVYDGMSSFVDVVTFVPVYQYELEKKVFSKNTYNEIPAGFELKKNIHVRYSNPEKLNEIMAVLSTYEIYDLIRVDYFSTEMEQLKNELRSQASEVLVEKLKSHEKTLNLNLDSAKKSLVDGFMVMLPTEQYRSYQAYASSSLNLKNNQKMNQSDKSTTLYYQPVVDKEFDFVINPVVLQPVIQVIYEIKMSVDLTPKIENSKLPMKTYMLITPNGDLKAIQVE